MEIIYGEVYFWFISKNYEEFMFEKIKIWLEYNVECHWDLHMVFIKINTEFLDYKKHNQIYN